MKGIIKTKSNQAKPVKTECYFALNIWVEIAASGAKFVIWGQAEDTLHTGPHYSVLLVYRKLQI